jgi:hypothetical protein
MIICAACALAGLSSPALADEDRPVTITLNATGQAVFKTDLKDSPGDVSIYRVGVGAELGIPIRERGLLTAGFDGEYSVYDFKEATGLIPGTADPLDDAFRDTFSLRYAHQHSADWAWLVGGSVRASGDTNADLGDTITYGVFAGATHTFNDRFSATLGASVRTRLEDDPRVLPLLMFDWRIADRWRLRTTGTTGILSYELDDEWTLTLDAGWNEREYRLADDGSLPDGVLRDQRLPVAVGLVWNASDTVSIHARGGAIAWQEYTIDNSNGDEVSQVESDPAGFIELGGSVRF